MTIVCGTDFSVNAEQAARAAAAIARRMRTQLVLAHVIDTFEAEGSPSSAFAPSRAKLLSQASQLGADFGIEVVPIARLGVEYETLLTIAREKDARMIVVAFLGEAQQSRWSLGSVAERLVQTSPVPVLMVRESASIEAWTCEDGPLRVMVGVEIAATARSALRFATSLRQIAPCDLRITQIAWPAQEHARLGIGQPIPLDRLRPELHELLLRDLRAWAGEVEGPGETVFVVSPGWGRIDHHLVSVAAANGADLLVVGTHQRAGTARLWQGSVSRGVLEQASSNVLCVPRGEAEPVEAQEVANFHRVLVSTDLSADSNRAIPVAYGLVAPMGVVHLVHVVTRKGRETDADLTAQLTALVPRRAESRGVRTELEIVHERDVSDGIAHLAARHAVDAICMATHGRSGVSQMLFGSEAQSVLARVRQPVVLVPPEPV